MAVLTDLDIADLVAGTLRDLGEMKFEQIAQTYQDYEVFGKWFKEDKIVFDSGIGIQRTLMNRLSGAASHVGLMDADNVNLTDLIDQLQIPWRHAVTSWTFNRQEMLMNRGKALIFNVVKPRRADAMISLAEELEVKGWTKPSSSSNKVDPYGITYWIVKASGTPSFQGGAPSGFSDVGGVSLTDSPTFKNWTGQYVLPTKDDLVKKMRTMHRKCRFKSPVDSDDYRSGKGERYRVYVNETTFSAFEDIGEAQNENLGRDIASIDGFGMAFRGNPIRWIPYLDTDTSNPVYMIDHSTFYPTVLKGDYLRESDVKVAPHQHNWFQVFVDLTYNYICVDRRRNGVLYV